MKVLIADDSVMVIDRIMEILRELPGLEIAGCAKDANETLQLVGQLDPQVIILDLEMPGGSALDVLRAIKAGRPHIVAIVLTNSASIPFRKACTTVGAEFFLDKSYEFDQLRGILAQIVQSAGVGTRRIHVG